ncbi:hypothetical protein MLGJGCBP_02315 [Rhodococcus sp. T7]|nr:hypothetical protein MLGJGCBP_02315 [Rhodococcus sp. T7]
MAESSHLSGVHRNKQVLEGRCGVDPGPQDQRPAVRACRGADRHVGSTTQPGQQRGKGGVYDGVIREGADLTEVPDLAVHVSGHAHDHAAVEIS